MCLSYCSTFVLFTSGKVMVNGRVVNKAGTPVSDKSNVEINAEIPKYVCRWLLHETNSWGQILFSSLHNLLTSSVHWSSFLLRAGYKLEAAIEQLGVEVEGKVALDSGLSTGGFTDCLLQYGASFVYGVDVGYGQVISIIFYNFIIHGLSHWPWNMEYFVFEDGEIWIL